LSLGGGRIRVESSRCMVFSITKSMDKRGGKGGKACSRYIISCVASQCTLLLVHYVTSHITGNKSWQKHNVISKVDIHEKISRACIFVPCSSEFSHTFSLTCSLAMMTIDSLSSAWNCEHLVADFVLHVFHLNEEG